jgi:hypothetical protein
MEARLLFWIWFAVVVFFGIASAADILGNGPQAYIGGLFTGAAYVAASRLMPKRAQTSDGDEAQRAPVGDHDILAPRAIPLDILDDRAAREKFPTPRRQKEKRRHGRSNSNKPERSSILDQLRGIWRRFGK